MKNYKAHILVVDDDDGIRNLVKKFLNEKSFLVNTASSSEEAQKKIAIIKFDLIILDIMMPGKSGLEFLNENKSFIDTPVILLTAKGEPKERVEGLESGADDYLPKPFEPQELLLRIKNILSKTQKKNLIRAINFGNIKIDLTKLLIIKEKKELKINTTEKKILDKMINQPGKVFSRLEIGKLINLEKERSIDVIITRLRKKIEMNPKNPKYLQTIRGTGYVLWIE
jgi:two-component system phosphate regulon response regulator OmpR